MPDESITLDPKINEKVVSNLEDKAVQTALKVIEDLNEQKVRRDTDNWFIQELFENGFVVKTPKGNRKINSKMLQQAIWKTVSRTKPLDFMVHGSGREEVMERLVTDGISTVMEKGGYVRSLRDKDGAFFKLYLYGDAFIQVGTNPEEDSEIPIIFNPISNSNIYVDSFATSVRGAGFGKSVTKMVVIFSYSWAEAIRLYPALKRKGGGGKVPRDTSLLKDTERSFEQQNEVEKDLVEIAHFYDISNKNYTIFAGEQATILKQLNGDKYPFIKDGKPYIPVLQYICMPSAEGFYNHGIGDMVYDLALISQRLMNMEVGHIEDNVYPVTLLNVPKGEAAKFFNKLALAHEMRNVGKKGFVSMEYDPSNPGAGQVQAQSLLTNNLVNEWQLVMDRLDRELKRLGINLDEIERGTNVTASQIIAEEEGANAFVKQVMENNASESQFAVELTLDFIKEFVNKNSDVPLNMTTKLQLPEGEVRADGITLGMVADEIKKNDYFVRINARTGAVPSNVMQQAQITRMLSVTQPGTPAYLKLVQQFAQLNDRDLSPEDFGAPPVQEAGASVPTEDIENPTPTATDRIQVNPRQAQPVAAF